MADPKWKHDTLYLNDSGKLIGQGQELGDLGRNREMIWRTRFMATPNGVEMLSIGFRLNSKGHYGTIVATEDNPQQQAIEIKMFLDGEEDSSFEDTFVLDVDKLDEQQYIHEMFIADCSSIAVQVLHRNGRAFELDYIGVTPRG